MTTLIDQSGNKYMEVGNNTRLRCMKTAIIDGKCCAYSDHGACLYPGTVIIGISCEKFATHKPKTKIPKDYETPACSSGIRCWVTARFYGKTQEEVIEKRNKYLKKYPHEGYSTYDCTVLQQTTEALGEFWFSVVMRYSTCD